MKVIDAMQKITNGEEFRFKILSENKTYHVYKDSQIFDEEDEDYVQWFIDYDWLNEEIEIIEDKKIERITNKAFLNSPFGELVGEKFNEIIDAINGMREDK
jgi:hypothetical protein